MECLFLRMWPHGAVILYLRQLLSVLRLHDPLCSHVWLWNSSGKKSKQVIIAEVKGHSFTMPLATVMHRRVNPHVLLSAASCWARARSDWWDVRNSSSSRRAALQHTDAGSPAALTANNLSCCCVTCLTLEKRESSLSHQRELRNISAMTAGCNETWCFSFFITSSS